MQAMLLRLYDRDRHRVVTSTEMAASSTTGSLLVTPQSCWSDRAEALSIGDMAQSRPSLSF
ncbi:MAG: hypothetical protein AAF704_03000 [Cyanobacteria bacterium P01_D01_bin.123]